MADSRSLSLSPWKSKRPFVIISPHDPKAMHHQVKQCKAYGLRLFYDVGQQANSLGDRDILSGIEATEILIANDYEITVICHKIGMSASKLKALVPIVVTTLGGDGSIIEGKNVPSALKIDAVKPKRLLIQPAPEMLIVPAFYMGISVVGICHLWAIGVCMCVLRRRASGYSNALFQF